VKRFSDKKRGKNKKLERFTEPSEVKTALEPFLFSFGFNEQLYLFVLPQLLAPKTVFYFSEAALSFVCFLEKFVAALPRLLHYNNTWCIKLIHDQ